MSPRLRAQVAVCAFHYSESHRDANDLGADARTDACLIVNYRAHIIITITQ